MKFICIKLLFLLFASGLLNAQNEIEAGAYYSSKSMGKELFLSFGEYELRSYYSGGGLRSLKRPSVNTKYGRFKKIVRNKIRLTPIREETTSYPIGIIGFKTYNTEQVRKWTKTYHVLELNNKTYLFSNTDFVDIINRANAVTNKLDSINRIGSFVSDYSIREDFISLDMVLEKIPRKYSRLILSSPIDTRISEYKMIERSQGYETFLIEFDIGFREGVYEGMKLYNTENDYPILIVNKVQRGKCYVIFRHYSSYYIELPNSSNNALERLKKFSPENWMKSVYSSESSYLKKNSKRSKSYKLSDDQQ